MLNKETCRKKRRKLESKMRILIRISDSKERNEMDFACETEIARVTSCDYW